MTACRRSVIPQEVLELTAHHVRLGEELFRKRHDQQQVTIPKIIINDVDQQFLGTTIHLLDDNLYAFFAVQRRLRQVLREIGFAELIFDDLEKYLGLAF